MKINSSAWLIGAVMVGAVGISGCATKEYVNQSVAVVDQKVAANSARLDQDDAHLATLDANTREALQRAEAAHKLAEGKFLYHGLVRRFGEVPGRQLQAFAGSPDSVWRTFATS